MPNSILIVIYTMMFLSILCTFGAVCVRDPLVVAMYYIGVVITSAVVLYLLSAELLGLMLLTIYIGAVVILFLFMLMMLNLRAVVSPKLHVHARVVLLTMLLPLTYLSQFSSVSIREYRAESYNTLNAELIGFDMLLQCSEMFILAGCVLLLTLIGSIYITKE